MNITTFLGLFQKLLGFFFLPRTYPGMEINICFQIPSLLQVFHERTNPENKALSSVSRLVRSAVAMVTRADLEHGVSRDALMSTSVPTFAAAWINNTTFIREL